MTRFPPLQPRVLSSLARPKARSDQHIAQAPAQAVTPESLLARWQAIFDMHRAVAGLPREYREVLVLADLEGLDTAQVGWLLDLDEDEATARLVQARALLHEQLAGAEQGETT